MVNITENKQALRKTIAERLANLKPEVRCAHDARLCGRAERLAEFADIQIVMGYMPLPDEIDLKPLLRKLLDRGIKLALPRIDPDTRSITPHQVTEIDHSLRPGPYCILEPSPSLPAIPVGKISLVLVPGRAFSPEGYRLGRGGGYYDRFLDECPAIRIAFCYEEQLLTHIPVESHDLPVDLLVTPERVLRNHEALPGRDL